LTKSMYYFSMVHVLSCWVVALKGSPGVPNNTPKVLKMKTELTGKIVQCLPELEDEFQFWVTHPSLLTRVLLVTLGSEVTKRRQPPLPDVAEVNFLETDSGYFSLKFHTRLSRENICTVGQLTRMSERQFMRLIRDKHCLGLAKKFLSVLGLSFLPD
jgi:hypothetical protein